eukprot:8097614-Lingulodinium_polyedra.AAC.1
MARATAEREEGIFVFVLGAWNVFGCARRGAAAAALGAAVPVSASLVRRFYGRRAEASWRERGGSPPIY